MGTGDIGVKIWICLHSKKQYISQQLNSKKKDENRGCICKQQSMDQVQIGD